jgi:predicted RNA polymerase sigma factor
LILYEDQDSSLWNEELIARGKYFLNEAAKGNKLSKYHAEAAIAYWHTRKEDTPEKWEGILQLYNRLLVIEYSPIAALNRTYALSKASGKEAAIIEAEKLKLTTSHLYYLLLGDLYTGIDNEQATEHLKTALKLAKSKTDKAGISKSIKKIEEIMP